MSRIPSALWLILFFRIPSAYAYCYYDSYGYYHCSMWSTSVRIGLGIGLVVLAIIASIAFTIMRKRRLTQINQSYIPGGPGRGGPAPTSYNAPYGGYPPTDQAYPTAWYPDPNTPGQFGYQPSGNQGPTYPQYPPQSYQANESPHNQTIGATGASPPGYNPPQYAPPPGPPLRQEPLVKDG